jgi:CheY-like chemotaxis protein
MNLKPILYAEDEEDDAFMVRKAFAKANIRNPLVVVPDGSDAIEYLSGTGPYSDRTAHPLPCLALMDISMPGTSGLDVLKWIRTQPALCALPVIMLTSSSQQSDIHRAYIQGANGFLVKPGSPNDLYAMAQAIKDYWLLQNRAIPTQSNSAS